MAEIKMKSIIARSINYNISRAVLTLKSFEHWKNDNELILEAYISVIQESQRYLDLAESQILESIYTCKQCKWKGKYLHLKPIIDESGLTQEMVCLNCESNKLKL